MIFIIYYVYKVIANFGRKIKGAFEPKYKFRSVGVQSQCTYDRQANRFKAYENGFRRSGEIEVELHEHFKQE